MSDWDTYVDPFDGGDPYEHGRKTIHLVDDAVDSMDNLKSQAFTAADGTQLTLTIHSRDGLLKGLTVRVGERDFKFVDRSDNTLVGDSELLYALADSE